MAQLLISVSTLAEAEVVLNKGVGIIDLKYPAKGALGALTIEAMQEITYFIRKRDDSKLITATIGDLPMQSDVLREAVEKTFATGVDVVKIGFFGVNDEAPMKVYSDCVDSMRELIEQGVKLVAVLFTEYEYPDGLIGLFKKAGFYGVMIDTAHKNGTTLLDYLSHQQIQNFVLKAKAAGLQAGLAGSVQLAQIPLIQQFQPDYIGLRGAVCMSGQRVNTLCEDRLETAANLFKFCCESATKLLSAHS